jgi:chemotaxis methyl-accepting protein methylase
LGDAVCVSGSEAEPACGLAEPEAELVRRVFSGAGLDASGYRSETLARRIAACLRFLRVEDPAQARRALEHDPRLIAPALGVLLVGVTGFFRDPSVFDAFERELLASRSSRRGFRIWSAGCSEGAELYSVALLLERAGRLRDSLLLGTDCRAEAIDRARAGCYRDDVVRAVPDGLRRFFQADAGGHRVVPEVRRSVRWEVADLMRDVAPGPWDAILFRNTAMYFRGEVTRDLWPRLEAVLRPGGLLVLGRSERPHRVHGFTGVHPCVFRKRGG